MFKTPLFDHLVFIGCLSAVLSGSALSLGAGPPELGVALLVAGLIGLWMSER